MCRSSTSTMGSIMTATADAAAQDSGRWAETNTRWARIGHDRDDHGDDRRAAGCARAAPAPAVVDGHGVPYRAARRAAARRTVRMAETPRRRRPPWGAGPPGGRRGAGRSVPGRPRCAAQSQRRRPSPGDPSSTSTPGRSSPWAAAALVASQCSRWSRWPTTCSPASAWASLVGVALSPVVSRGAAAAGDHPGQRGGPGGDRLALAIAAVVLLVAPAAVRQAQDFSDELPATVRTSTPGRSSAPACRRPTPPAGSRSGSRTPPPTSTTPRSPTWASACSAACSARSSCWSPRWA